MNLNFLKFNFRLCFGVILVITSTGALALENSPEWYCKNVASEKMGNIINSCGIGFGADESEARDLAFDHAKKEFDKICSISDDCQGHAVNANPKRTTCEEVGKKIKCYRLIEFKIGERSSRTHVSSIASSAVMQNSPVSNAPVTNPGPPDNGMSLSVEKVKDKKKKYDFRLNLKNDSNQFLLVNLTDILCFRGDVHGMIKNTFFNTGPRSIGLAPGEVKGKTLVCDHGMSAAGDFRVVVSRIYENPSHDGKTPGKVVGENLEWLGKNI